MQDLVQPKLSRSERRHQWKNRWQRPEEADLPNRDSSEKIANVCLALPIHGDGVREMWFSILETILNSPGRFNLSYAVITDQPIVEAREQLVKVFLQGNADYLLFVDSDMMWGKDAIFKLLEADKDIITGLITNRRQGQTQRAICYVRADDVVVWIKDLPSETELFQIDACGTAFMLIKRKVLETLGYDCFDRIIVDGKKSGFQEDVNFCIRAKDKGFQIWCDPQVKVGHVGRYIYTDSDVRSHI